MIKNDESKKVVYLVEYLIKEYKNPTGVVNVHMLARLITDIINEYDMEQDYTPDEFYELVRSQLERDVTGKVWITELRKIYSTDFKEKILHVCKYAYLNRKLRKEYNQNWLDIAMMHNTELCWLDAFEQYNASEYDDMKNIFINYLKKKANFSSSNNELLAYEDLDGITVIRIRKCNIYSLMRELDELRQKKNRRVDPKVRVLTRVKRKQ